MPTNPTVCSECLAAFLEEVVWCQFCNRMICIECDHPSEFGHTCIVCWAKIAVGAIDTHGVDRSRFPYSERF